MKEFKNYLNEVMKEYKRVETYFSRYTRDDPVGKVMDIAAQLYLADRLQETRIIDQENIIGSKLS